MGMQRVIDLFTDHRPGRYPYLGRTLARAEELNVGYRIVPPKWDIDTVEDIKSAPWDEAKMELQHTRGALRALGFGVQLH